MSTDDPTTALTWSATTRVAPRAPSARSLPILLLTLACVFVGVPGGAATPVNGASVAAASAAFHDDVVEATASQAGDLRVARATRSRRAWRSTRSASHGAVAWLRRAVGRWHQPPPAWRGPPILLT